MLDLKKLYYLEAIYKYRNFTRASEALFVSQPAISAAINSLESEIGIALMVRNSKNVDFTAEGEIFVQQALQILRLCDNLEANMKDLSSLAEETINLGISTSISNPIVPRIFSEFVAMHPRARIHLEEGALNKHLTMIRNDALDIAYNAIPEKKELEIEKLCSIPITTAEIFVVLHPQHPLAKRERIPLELLANEKLIMMSQESKVKQILQSEFEKRCLMPDIVFYYDQILCMTSVVQKCNYVGVISVVKEQVASGCERLVLRPMETSLMLDIGFIMKKDKYLPQIGRDLISFVAGLNDTCIE